MDLGVPRVYHGPCVREAQFDALARCAMVSDNPCGWIPILVPGNRGVPASKYFQLWLGHKGAGKVIRKALTHQP